jgi:Coenzyme PQQ synthesis protein D (PqqD).
LNESSKRSGRPDPSVLVAHLEGHAVLLHLVSKAYFRLNETGVAIWRGIERGDERDAIIASLVADFDVSAGDAEQALDALVAELRRHELIAGE